MVEVLIPDFQGKVTDLARVVTEAPDVIAHNVECVERLTSRVRDPRAGYQQSLDVLAAIKQLDPARPTKYSLMVGVGETEDELVQAMKDLRAVGCDFLTIGQYLQPTRKHIAVNRFVTPDEFGAYAQFGYAKGFLQMASTPLTRSSYHAGEDFEQLRAARIARLRGEAVDEAKVLDVSASAQTAAE